ncbi:MAG TPA: helix-turn-helix domain-containing protein [Terriglobales bacterium]|jgi:transcriptional regulator GlxA family with amidase domain|nr:helix-turn-helix domain-containing protein [Terriglobales bacterium]
MIPKRVAILGFEGMNSLDVAGPVEAFTSARIEAPNGPREACYEVKIIADQKVVTAESGIMFLAHEVLEAVSGKAGIDTLIIPGGHGLRVAETNARISLWLGRHARGIRRVATVCTGIYGLAPTGMLDGCRVTTHWRFAQDVAMRYPKLKVHANALYIKQGKFYTSAGITAGIDLALELIEEDFGPKVALTVAREMVVYLKRPGGQEQYSEPLQFQARNTGRFADLAAWMLAHLHGDLCVETLAERTCLSPRQFSRRFRSEFKSSPAAFVQALRLDEARRRLANFESTVENVAESVGFRDCNTFRRAFERRFGIAPSEYRSRFDLRSSHESARTAQQESTQYSVRKELNIRR